jgi:putative acyl-CoA dehydrogenase
MTDLANGLDVAAFNQSPPFADVNLFTADLSLQEAARRAGVDDAAEGLGAFGAAYGAAATLDLGRQANEYPPRLRVADAQGDRRDEVEFHPAYHALMAKSMAAGLHCSAWDGGKAAHATRAARLYIATQAESGHMCPTTMTNASVAALKVEPTLASAWLPRIRSRRYDPSFRPWWEKDGVTIGMGMTERQGGTDVRATITTATPRGDAFEIDGHKWFMSAPMSDAFLVLAQAPSGLTCFLVPRFRPDGSRNSLRFRRLKDKLGNRSNASTEVEFVAAHAAQVGAGGAGVRTIIAMVQMTRLDCAVAAAGQMRSALALAYRHVAHRSVFQRRLVDQPVMRAVVVDLALDSEAATALALRLAAAFDAAPTDPGEAAYARLLTPAVKYLLCKQVPGFVYEALECQGGNGYVEDFPIARLYREAPLNAIWEGSGNVMALDVLRAATAAPEAATRVLAALAAEAGPAGAALAEQVETGWQDRARESRARATTEQLARLAALAALNVGQPDLAATYAATRLAAGPSGWGARDLGDATDRLLERLAPVA